MTKLLSVLALASAFIPAALVAQTTQTRFTRDGVSYSYAVTPQPHGRRLIEGRRLTDGARFRLVVDGTRVDGTLGGQPVAFNVAAARPVTLAAR